LTTGKRSATPAGHRAARPRFPSAYGIPKSLQGTLSWSHVSERMTEALHYWVSTVTPDGRPSATPVDGIWLDERLYFGGSTETLRHRNLTANPSACVHLESAKDVVILHGRAVELKGMSRNLAVRLSEASNKKYGYGFKPDQYEKTPGIFEFRPRRVLAWKQFPKDVTSWDLSCPRHR
jgi:nitroimidazol reductase NimA-like FMN-containing flavoprotein (pyridoxamine 5'-phosphate oxidase superfamily)